MTHGDWIAALFAAAGVLFLIDAAAERPPSKIRLTPAGLALIALAMVLHFAGLL